MVQTKQVRACTCCPDSRCTDMNFPIISLYERQAKRSGVFTFYETVSSAAEKIFDGGRTLTTLCSPWCGVAICSAAGRQHIVVPSSRRAQTAQRQSSQHGAYLSILF